jgi:regulator of RNase E activity RraA
MMHLLNKINITRDKLKGNKVFCIILSAFLISLAFRNDASAQILKLSPEEMIQFTPLNPYGRFPDGRPMVPDALLDTIRSMKIEIVEAWSLLRQKGYPYQYEADWNILIPSKRLVGRSFTVQFMPIRADLDEAIQKKSENEGLGRMRNQTTIDMLQKNDVIVVDLFGKVEGGTFVGDKLAYYILKTTGTGIIIDGGLFYTDRIEATGMPAYYRGTHPGALTNVMITGINIPLQIGNAVVMPGDVVLGDSEGILFIPPQYVEEIIESVKSQRLRDEWAKKKFDTGRYKSIEIYGKLSPELQKEYDEFVRQRKAGEKK